MMLLLKIDGCNNVAAPVGPRIANMNLSASPVGYKTTLEASAAAGALPGAVSCRLLELILTFVAPAKAPALLY
jgi:hypothetical protein